MMRSCLTLFLSCYFVRLTLSDYFDQIARCELEALQLGTKIADSFNAPVNGEDWENRIYQNIIAENLGFAPWIAEGLPNSGGRTVTGEKSMELQVKGGWVGKDLAESRYHPLNHKWVYMLGDSTTRQIWASYAAPFQGNHFERNAKEWSRHYVSVAVDLDFLIGADIGYFM